MSYELIRTLKECIDRLDLLSRSFDADKEIIEHSVGGELKREYLRAIDELKTQINGIKMSICEIICEKEQLTDTI